MQRQRLQALGGGAETESVGVGEPLRGKWPALAIVALALIAIAWLRLPLLPTMLVLAPLSILLMWRWPS